MYDIYIYMIYIYTYIYIYVYIHFSKMDRWTWHTVFPLRSGHSRGLRGQQDRRGAGHGEEEVQLPGDASAALLFCPFGK